MTRSVRVGVVVALATLGVAAFAGCAAFPSTFCEYGFCTDGADASTDGPSIPPGCDTPTDPTKNAEKCLVDAFGAFVSPSGNDTNPGTRAAPFLTVGKALASAKPRVVLCEGEYTESVELTRPVELYGKVNCTFDRGGGATKLKATRPDYVVRVFRTANVRLTDLEITAAPGVAGTPGSFGVVVADSTNVSLVRLRIEAKAAGPATDGVLVPYTFPDPVLASIPGRGESGACPGGENSQGGQGGATLGAPGGDGLPRPSLGTNGKGATPNCGVLAIAGLGGTIGPNGGSALTVGEVTPAGWRGTPGRTGGPGTPGGGGGGGGYTESTSSVGGGGAAGGCGGAGGAGGGAGGASIALVTYASDLTLDACELFAGAPTAGGAGATTGQLGQGGAEPLHTGTSCEGAVGGAGGPGGLGGGGAGGVSAGLAWSGLEPKYVGNTTVVRAATNARGGAGAEGAVGVMGASVDILKAP